MYIFVLQYLCICISIDLFVIIHCAIEKLREILRVARQSSPAAWKVVVLKGATKTGEAVDEFIWKGQGGQGNSKGCDC
jgi:hypothetical protein